MPRFSRECSYCHESMAADEFKCKSCGNMVTTKTAKPKQPYMLEYEESILDRYSMMLLVLITLFLSPIAVTIGGVLLFNDYASKRDAGKILVTAGLIMMIVHVILYFAFW
ncbi:hypothetical protein GCM10008014_32410 [Paenibacillus silvae]|uniref:Zinc ribbon domain-containing protein n=1 Tax=Paenibacillus silvae TaxID=1325358 RepID=A0ABQ1ZD02_9BACL|nr:MULTISPECIES: hypothetical protein [Paenibacillus]GGH59122.1 hypothetical protein GCM10008014_32410 [Paenibacillus silvae]